MFNKEVIKLAKPFNDALKKIAESQERKCVNCKGMGGFTLSKERIIADPHHTFIKCPKCNGTGSIKAKWEWKPEVGEWYYAVRFRDIEPQLVQDSEICRDILADMMHGETFVPILPWERTLKILRGLGYSVFVETQSHNCRATIFRDGAEIIRKIGEDSQSAMMQAVIELGKRA